ncbi:S-adenosyl-L-methionine-dependent methyltransferase [Xylariaceae sp. FL1651]|nr:S-adenosyl-L-methionine-dependent methyltransferase [Xylariaceae sp. FL1651]
MTSPSLMLHEESVTSWTTNAAFWDDAMGQDGNKYWKCLQKPVLERMIPFQAGTDTRVLELATGNGLVARWLASNGASVLATDISEKMLEHARRRELSEHKGKIEYRLLDVTSSEALDTLARDDVAAGGFDVVIVNMALMDISTIEPLAGALPKLLKKDGIFVATLLHPVFCTSGAQRNIQLTDSGPDGYPVITRSKIISTYLNVPPTRGVAKYGQPVQQIYYHRPLHELFSVFFAAGLAMDAMEEPAFKAEDGTPERIESFSNYTELPTVLAFRMRIIR